MANAADAEHTQKRAYLGPGRYGFSHAATPRFSPGITRRQEKDTAVILGREQARLRDEAEVHAQRVEKATELLEAARDP
jgi:hypothetical protein